MIVHNAHKMEEQKKEKLLLAVFLLFLGLGFVDVRIPIVKYAKYLLPIASIVIFVIYNVKIYRQEKSVFLLILFLLFPVIYSVVTYKTKSPYFIKEAFLISLPILAAYTLSKIALIKKIKIFYIIFISIILSYIITCFTNDSANIIYIKESSLSFIFGFFAVYWLLKKKLELFIIASVFLIFSNKRISLIALIIFSICWIVFMEKWKIKEMINVSFLALIFGSFSYIYSIKMKYLELLEKKFNIITSGRIYLYELFRDYFNNSFWGHGVGFVRDRLAIIYNREYNLHSDILKYFLDIGTFGLLVQIILFWYFVYKNRNLNSIKYFFSFIIFTAILYLTDNVSIYVNYIFPALTLVFYEMEKEIIYDHIK